MKTKTLTGIHLSSLGELLLGIGLVVVQLFASPMPGKPETVSERLSGFTKIQKWKVPSQATPKGYQESSGTSKGSLYITFNQS